MNTYRVESQKDNACWQVQEAKAMFSELVKAAAVRPQIVTVHGKEAAVIVSIDEYRKMTCPNQTLYEFIQNSPLFDVKLESPERLAENAREIQL